MSDNIKQLLAQISEMDPDKQQFTLGILLHTGARLDGPLAQAAAGLVTHSGYPLMRALDKGWSKLAERPNPDRGGGQLTVATIVDWAELSNDVRFNSRNVRILALLGVARSYTEDDRATMVRASKLDPADVKAVAESVIAAAGMTGWLTVVASDDCPQPAK